MPPRADEVRIHPKLLACLGDDPAQDQDLAQVGDDSEELAKLMDGSGSSSESTTKGKGQLPSNVVHPSRGSEKHHSGSCQPCSFFIRGKCTVAEGCLYCHYEHDRPQRPGKKSRERAKRRIATAKATEPSYAGASSPPGTVPDTINQHRWCLVPVFLSLALGAPDFAEEAKKASEKAWEHAKEVKKSSKDAAKIAEEVKAAGKGAKKALKKAKELDAKMTALFESTREATVQAATQAAMAYYEEVKKAGAQAAAEAASPAVQIAAKKAEETRVAEAASEAAKPYREAQLRDRKLAADYQLRAQAMNAQGNQLQVEGASLAPIADSYQKAGSVEEANQMIRKAHLLVDQGLKLKRQAKKIHQNAVELNSALPQYAIAEQAASLHAASMAAEPTLPTNAPPY